MVSSIELPDSESPDLHLCQLTPEECIKIWSNTAHPWKDLLTIPMYLVESRFLTTVPLAKDGGMTNWALVDRNQLPDQRQILCSCETFWKRCLISDQEGNTEEGIVHGVASVFCPQEYRGRGYGTRHMKELAKAAKVEAAKWRLSQVQIWEPSPLAQSLLRQSGLDANRVERQTDSIASTLWFRRGSDFIGEYPQWINNEYYAWC